MRRAALTLLLPALALTSCATQNTGDYRAYLARKGIMQSTPTAFSHCHGYGCRLIDHNLLLTQKEWAQLRLIFLRPVENADDERERIAQAIAFFEQRVGAITGTAADVGGTYRKLGDNQHDCVDESVNTTIYLSLLEQENLLLYHKVGTPTARMPILTLLGPHQTAVIVEKDSDNAFAVDSWFHDNGTPPEIVPLDDWFFGWRPD